MLRKSALSFGATNWRSLRLAVALAGIALCTGLLPGCGPLHPTVSISENVRPGIDFNVVIILVDTLRPDHLGCYGYERASTPHIDALAAEGVVFENARTTSTYTGEAVASLFTGRPPAMIPDGLGWGARPTPMQTNLPNTLAGAGYRTGIFSTSFVMRFRGFYDSFQEASLFPGIENTSALDQELTTEAIGFLKKHQGTPVFQYLHYYAPHAPYNPPATFLERFQLDRTVLAPSDDVHPAALVSAGMEETDLRLDELRKHYDGEIALIDQAIGRYMDYLRGLDMDRNTIVVLLSDHGEEFMEHGFADHAWNLYDETLRIPMIVWAPDLFAPERVTEAVSIADVMPTLLRCLSVPHTSFDDPALGEYLFEFEQDRWQYRPRTGAIYASLFPESRAQLHAVLFEDYKYITGPRWLTADDCKRFWMLQSRLAGIAQAGDFLPLDPWAPAEREVLYNLRTDPGETRDLSSTEADALERARALLHAYQESSEAVGSDGSQTTQEDPFTDDFIHRQLEQLVDTAPETEQPGNTGERLHPELLQGLEAMGYL